LLTDIKSLYWVGEWAVS